MKFTLFLLFVFGAEMALFGQDSKYEKLVPFNDEQFNKRLKEHPLFGFDSLQKIQGSSIALKGKNNYAMRWAEVHEEDMIQMPNMPIKTDFHYSLHIKKYDLQYPYNNTPKKDSRLNNGELVEPMKKPRK